MQTDRRIKISGGKINEQKNASDNCIGKNCEYMNDSKRSCRILKHLYCKLEPDKKCSWYKQKGSCKNGEIKVAEKDI